MFRCVSLQKLVSLRGILLNSVLESWEFRSRTQRRKQILKKAGGKCIDPWKPNGMEEFVRAPSQKRCHGSQKGCGLPLSSSHEVNCRGVDTSQVEHVEQEGWRLMQRQGVLGGAHRLTSSQGPVASPVSRGRERLVRL